MASSRDFLSEEQFQCSICREVFSCPVSAPCGHSFCRACILGYWQGRGACQCPRCGTDFAGWPGLCENTFAREMAEKLRQMRLGCLEPRLPHTEPRPPHAEPRPPHTELRPPHAEPYPPHTEPRLPHAEPYPPHSEEAGLDMPGGVACDMCVSGKQRAVESCQACLTSSCQPHLEPHLREEGLPSHTLLPPLSDLEDRTCWKHRRPLELFCRSDRACVCVLCANSDLRSHDTVPAERVWSERQAQLKKAEAEMQQMIQDRRRKVGVIRQRAELSRSSTQREKEDSVQVFGILKHSIETHQARLTEVMEEKEKAAEKRAEGLIKDLEQELTELQTRSTELEKLSQTEDHLYVLQSFPSLHSPPNTRDWSIVSVHTDVCVGTMRRALEQLRVSLTQQVDKLAEKELQKLHQYSECVVLDGSTAHPWLALCAAGRGVRDGDERLDVPDEPPRFDTAPCVLARLGFTSGRRYWEVWLGGKTDWDVGVARESIGRKGRVILAPEYGYWALCLRAGSEFWACVDPPAPLPLTERPGTVGVYLDYEEGQVSFYHVEAGTHIYTFSACAFTEKLYPYFSPGVNDNGSNAAALVILPPANHVRGGACCDGQQGEESVKL